MKKCMLDYLLMGTPEEIKEAKRITSKWIQEEIDAEIIREIESMKQTSKHKQT